MSTTNEERTLAQRMAEGRIPVSEALHHAMSLAEALRKLHDAGKAHGAITPASVVLAGAGVELIPSLEPQATVTPYTAPEVLQGQPADSRSDVFSFGAVVYEMLTGRRAFEGEGQTELTLALTNAAPPPSGSPAVDRLVTACVAKSPAARWQRMQKIILELKLLTVAARRAEAQAAPRRASEMEVLRAEFRHLEGRFSARLAEYEHKLAGMQQSAGEAVESLQQQVAGLHAELAIVKERPVVTPADLDVMLQQIHGRVEETIAAVSQQLGSQVGETVEAANTRHTAEMQGHFAALKQEIAEQMKSLAEAAREQHGAEMRESIAAAARDMDAKTAETVSAVNQRMEAAERSMEEIHKHFATLQENVAADLHDFEKAQKSQSVAIESARTAMSQTDDLVERVVEALELLQSSMIDQHEASSVN